MRFVDAVSSCFATAKPDEDILHKNFEITFSGEAQVKEIMQRCRISDANKVKPGVGETTRVLLRRIPWKILIREGTECHLKHVLMLAHDRHIPVETYNSMSYSCCGLIKDMLAGE